jgi:hypothetical protein
VSLGLTRKEATNNNSRLFIAPFLLGFSINPEDGRDTLLRNIGDPPAGYKTLKLSRSFSP